MTSTSSAASPIPASTATPASQNPSTLTTGGESGSAAVPGNAQADPEIPKTASEAPLFGVEAQKGVPFGEQVKGHAKYFAGKFFQNDKEVQQGAARVRGESSTLPEHVKHPSTKAAEAREAERTAEAGGVTGK